MKVFFDHSEKHCEQLVSFWFRPEQQPRFEAGQFAELYLPHANTDDRGERRWFSLTSVPGEPLLSFTARFPSKHSSFKQTLLDLKPGSEATLSDALGDFVLPKDPNVPLVWLAGGVGSAAFVGMARSIAARNEKRDIQFFLSVRDSSELIFSDIWEAAKIIPHQTVTNGVNWQGRRSRFMAEDLLLAAGDRKAETLFFVAGPESMVNDICSQLLALGVNPSQLVREAFTGY